MEKKFERGSYTSIVSKCYHIQLRETNSVKQLFLPLRLELGPDVFFFLLSQKAFHTDVASVMRKWLKEEELLPEDQRPTSQAKAHYVQVSFPPLPNLPRL